MKQFFCYEEPDNAQKKCDLEILARPFWMGNICLLYTSDAADE